MNKINHNKKLYTNLTEVISDFTYRELIYFLYNLGMDYYDGLNVMSRVEWQGIFAALKENYIRYEVEKTIRYREFRQIMAVLIGNTFYKHPHVYEIMTDALTSFNCGNNRSKLKHLIRDLEYHEALDQELREEDTP